LAPRDGFLRYAVYAACLTAELCPSCTGGPCRWQISFAAELSRQWATTEYNIHLSALSTPFAFRPPPPNQSTDLNRLCLVWGTYVSAIPELLGKGRSAKESFSKLLSSFSSSSPSPRQQRLKLSHVMDQPSFMFIVNEDELIVLQRPFDAHKQRGPMFLTVVHAIAADPCPLLGIRQISDFMVRQSVVVGNYACNRLLPEVAVADVCPAVGKDDTGAFAKAQDVDRK
jgi:hypothetical protein